MNARVVLPRNRREGTEFLKFSPERTWIGLWNANRTIGRESWTDVNGKKPKYRGVQLIRTMEIGKKTYELAAPCMSNFFDKIMDFSSRISDNF